MSNPMFCCQNTHQSAVDLVYAKQKKKMNSWKFCRTIFNTDILHVVIEKKITGILPLFFSFGKIGHFRKSKSRKTVTK